MPQPHDRSGRDRLSAIIHFLGDLLGDVIRTQAGQTAYESEEKVRALSKELRAQHTDSRAAELQDHIAHCDVDELKDLIKAFSTYFALVNLSEQLQRSWILNERERQARRNHEPTRESVGLMGQVASCRPFPPSSRDEVTERPGWQPRGLPDLSNFH